MKVFTFDRDRTVDVNPAEGRRNVPLIWVRHLAHETEHEVWAIGNQKLTTEADIPGMTEGLDRTPDVDPAVRTGINLEREDRVRLVGELFPDAEEYIVVDDIDLKHVDGWTHYYPWTFVRAVERGEIDVDLPPVRSTLPEEFGEGVAADYDDLLAAAGDDADHPTVVLLAAAKHDLLLEDVKEWAREIHFANDAVFNRRAKALQKAGLLETGTVLYDTSHPYTQLSLAEEFRDADAADLLERAG